MIGITFANVGRERASFSATIQTLDYESLRRLVRKHLMSQDLAFELDDKRRTGEVLAGIRPVGSFCWEEIASK